MVDSRGIFSLAAGLMSSTDPKRPVIEQPPDGPSEAPVSDRALKLRVRQQEILAELGVVALRGTSFMELLDKAVQLAAEGLEAEFCKILEYIPSEKRLLMRAGVGWDAGVVGKASVGADLESPAGFALHTGKPVISNQLENEQRFRTSELLASHGVRRAINVILQGDGVPFGVLEVDSKSEGDFSEKDIAFLQGAANIIGMAIERQRFERNLKAALEHQQVLVKEINHRVKNSLQLVGQHAQFACRGPGRSHHQPDTGRRLIPGRRDLPRPRSPLSRFRCRQDRTAGLSFRYMPRPNRGDTGLPGRIRIHRADLDGNRPRHPFGVAGHRACDQCGQARLRRGWQGRGKGPAFA